MLAPCVLKCLDPSFELFLDDVLRHDVIVDGGAVQVDAVDMMGGPIAHRADLLRQVVHPAAEVLHLLNRHCHCALVGGYE